MAETTDDARLGRNAECREAARPAAAALIYWLPRHRLYGRRKKALGGGKRESIKMARLG